MNNQLAQVLELPGKTPTDPTIVEGFLPFKFSTIGDIISGAIPFIFAFAGIGLLLMIISAGFTLLTSAGDAKKLDMGKNKLTYALVGFVIIFVAYWMTQLAGNIFGLDSIIQIFK